MAVSFLNTPWYKGYRSLHRAVSVQESGNQHAGRPGIADVVSSKRFRLTSLGCISLVSLYFFASQAPSGLPQLSSFRTGLSSTLTSTTSTPKSSQEEHASSPSSLPSPPLPATPEVDWSRFAYVQYVTDSEYLCNAVMVFETLHRLGAKADRAMLYPSVIIDPTAATSDKKDGRLVLQARDEYGVKLVPIEIHHKETQDATWAESFTKLLAFNQTQYDRVLSLDSDGTVLQTMDELFLIPPSPIAMPRAYWLWPEKQQLSSQLMLVQPSAAEFQRVTTKIESVGDNDYDMEIVNYLYGDTALVLPHRPYDLLTAEFRHDLNKHKKYLGSSEEAWNPVAVFNEAKYLHFSDWPMKKPWKSPTTRSGRRLSQAASTTRRMSKAAA